MNIKTKYLNFLNQKKYSENDKLNNQNEIFIKDNIEPILKLLKDEIILNKTKEVVKQYIKGKKYKIAILLLEIIVINSKETNLFILLAKLNLEIGITKIAKTYIDKIYEENLSVEQMKICANIYFRNKNFLRCIQSINRIRDKIGLNVEDTLLMFECYRRMHDSSGLENEINNMRKIELTEFQEFYINILTLLFYNNFEDAILKLEKVKNIYNNKLEYLFLYAVVLNKFKKFKEAIEILEKTKKISEINYSMGVFNNYLNLGKKQEGFYHLSIQSKVDEYEKLFLSNNFKQWHGENLTNKTIYIYAGNGFGKGDILFFFRYVFDLSKHFDNSNIILLLNDLSMQYLLSVDKINVQKLSELKDYLKTDNKNYFSSLAEVAYVYALKNDNIPKDFITLHRDNEKREYWSNYLYQYKDKCNIGINWKGNRNYDLDIYRSLKIEQLDILFKNAQFNFFILNNDLTNEETRIISNYSNVYILDRELFIDEAENSFIETLEIMKIMDINITTDTALAHLSFSLNLNSIILLEYSPYWYWNKKYSYYNQNKTVRLIYQKSPGNWESVIEKVDDLLKKDNFNDSYY